MNMTTWSNEELARQFDYYGDLLKRAVKAGLGLKDLETAEAWKFFKQLMGERTRRVRMLIANPHRYN